ncbi:MAG: 3-phosphoshikimate 1-carboxyvinyltransferase, partial [Ruminococcaceae bacterium]|nr:3-phosphoshikimate 1-carboxyvinyltransferase [Oscillospiraceae bacterium]
AATIDLLHAIGGEAQADENTMTIKGGRKLTGGVVDSYNDHRIAMTAAVASLWCEHPVTICTPMSVRKSYPHFYDDFAKIGGVSYGSSVGE